tara:strand:+ start:239 stop:1324 length:1086 start_codon:yes stop_codon:yes gene_type:complete
MIKASLIPNDNTSDRTLVRKYLDQLHIPANISEEEKTLALSEIKELMLTKNAKLVAHYYTDSSLQELAENTGGYVGDSLEMARFGRDCDADLLIVAGVKFMGETAKILSPFKKVIMPTLEATCSLDIACPIDKFAEFCAKNSDREVVVYANTSAAVKAKADWVVTSSIAVDLVEHLGGLGKKILWAPDKHLGSYIQKKTQVDMLIWDAACIVHEEFKFRGIQDMKAIYPDAAVLAHPESPESVLQIADMVGSTTQIINAANELPNNDFIVATDRGIFHKLRLVAPDKNFIIAPTAGDDATCRSCASCPWMSMNSLKRIAESLRAEMNEIIVEKELAEKAMAPLERMLNFAESNRLGVKGKA